MRKESVCIDTLPSSFHLSKRKMISELLRTIPELQPIFYSSTDQLSIFQHLKIGLIPLRQSKHAECATSVKHHNIRITSCFLFTKQTCQLPRCQSINWIHENTSLPGDLLAYFYFAFNYIAESTKTITIKICQVSVFTQEVFNSKIWIQAISPACEE